MSEHNIRNTAMIANKIVDVLGNILKKLAEIAAAIVQLPELIKKIVLEINSSSNRIIQSSGEMEIYSRIANAVSKKALIGAENEAIADFKGQLDEDYKLIADRYDKIQQDLEDDARKRVRQLDEVLLSLPDKFPKAFGESVQMSKNILGSLHSIFLESYKFRSAELNGKMRECMKKIYDFVEGRKSFIDKYDTLKHAAYVPSCTKYLPFYVLEYEDKDGKKYSRVLIQRERNTLMKIKESGENNALDMIQSNLNQNRKVLLDQFLWKSALKKDTLLSALVNVPEKENSVLNKLIDNSNITTAV